MTTGLSCEEVLDLIAQIGDQDAVLIGVQAVALWTQFYHLTPNLPVLSSDIDFLGDSDAAEQASEKLIRYAARLYLPNLDDPTPNSGKIALDLPGHPDPIEIDYLYAITGLDSDDIARRAVTLNLNQHRLKILHPVQCLESKIANLAFYPSTIASPFFTKPFGTSQSPKGVKNWRRVLPSAARVRPAFDRSRPNKGIGTWLHNDLTPCRWPYV
ncbi:hypothetical protein [Methylocaldum sp. SAD2]|uniref:hypothetical protein n=1 Tax=Methylocaldum sp. GT1BB TaxID=3438963 RepID=UPI00111C1944